MTVYVRRYTASRECLPKSISQVGITFLDLDLFASQWQDDHQDEASL